MQIELPENPALHLSVLLRARIFHVRHGNVVDDRRVQFFPLRGVVHRGGASSKVEKGWKLGLYSEYIWTVGGWSAGVLPSV